MLLYERLPQHFGFYPLFFLQDFVTVLQHWRVPSRKYVEHAQATSRFAFLF